MWYMKMKLRNYYKIAIVGSSEKTIAAACRDKLLDQCNKIGEILSDKKCIVMFGGDDGVGYEIAKVVANREGITMAFLPGNTIDIDKDAISIPIFTELGYGMREIMMLRSCEGVITLSGGAGTLAEICNAYHMYKPIVTLRDLGGWSEKLIDQYIDKREKVKIEAYDDANKMIEELIKSIKRNRTMNKLHEIL